MITLPFHATAKLIKPQIAVTRRDLYFAGSPPDEKIFHELANVSSCWRVILVRRMWFGWGDQIICHSSHTNNIVIVGPLASTQSVPLGPDLPTKAGTTEKKAFKENSIEAESVPID